MSQIVQNGQINTTALYVPDLYVQILPPTIALLNGVPTNKLGIVGTASWGPVNSPTIVGNMSQYAAQFGPIQARTFDAGTAAAAAVLQGANNMSIVRVTDGTDTAASVIIQTSCLTVTSKYTGSLANADTFTISAGTAANSWKAVFARAGYVPEVFDNLAAGLSGNAVWVAIASAINNGVSGLRGPSNYVVASAGAGTTAPSAASYTLSGGTDGVTSITSSVMTGQDTVPRKGMYALRNTGASIGVLADLSDTTTFSTQAAFALSEGIYMIGVTPAGDTIANAVSTKATAGIDSYGFKYLFGDWVYFLDTVNAVTRLISPQGFVAGLLANLSPQNSSLNKQIYGIVGTQKSHQNQVYSSSDIQALAQGGIDVICNPAPGGAYFAARLGHNSSSNPVIHGDNYTRMTNYIAATLAAGMGQFVGALQSAKPSDTTRLSIGATLAAFYQALKDANMIDDFSVTCDLTNNPPNEQALGYCRADSKVRYLSVIEYLIANIEGGQSVQINKTTTPV